jgi:ribosomal protein L19E
MSKIESISNYKEYLIFIKKWNDYSSDEQETLRAWYRKYYQENKEQEKQRYRQYYQDNKGNEKARLRRVKMSLQTEQKASALVDEES